MKLKVNSACVVFFILNIVFVGRNFAQKEAFSRPVHFNLHQNTKSNIDSITSYAEDIYELETDSALHLFEKADLLAASSGNSEAQSRIAGDVGYIYFLSGEYEKALNYFELEKKYAIKKNYTKGVASSLMHLGHLRTDEGKNAEAIGLFNSALAMVRNKKELLSEEIHALSHIASVSEVIGKKDTALLLLEEALPLAKILKDDNVTAMIQNNLGGIYR
ncbi:MAG: tetratricopeptide repeat protein, partial [Bacteroidia bacterium]|nr:tetratricopeptide repeat protein [Bacteroidia bacterium]